VSVSFAPSALSSSDPTQNGSGSHPSLTDTADGFGGSAVRATGLLGWARTEIQAVGKNPDLLSPCHPDLAAFSAFGVPFVDVTRLRRMRAVARTTFAQGNCL
jgi:hypothetical protein